MLTDAWRRLPSVFDGDYDDRSSVRSGWRKIRFMRDGEFVLEPSLDTEEGRTAADEWDER